MITLSKTGKIYTYTHTQENYLADNVLQVLGHIISTDPEFKNTATCHWTINPMAEKPWICYRCRYTPDLYSHACPRYIMIFSEV